MSALKYRIDVQIVDDHTMFAESLAEAVNSSDVAHVSHTFATLEACRHALAKTLPDVLLLDISMPDGSGINFCRQVLAEYPKVRLIAVTVHDEYSVIQRMMDSGAHGYLLKSSPVSELITAIQCVWRNGRYVSAEVEEIVRRSKEKKIFLTPVERNVLRLICDGLTNPEIAPQLSMSVETVNWYRKRLLAKLGVKNTVGLVTLALRQKLV